MRKSFKVLSGVFAFVFVSALLLQIDDDLLPEAQALIDKAQLPEESEAYFYLMGVGVAEGLSPEIAGRETFSAYVLAEKKYLEDRKPDQLPRSFIEDSLPLPKGELTCDLEEKDCVDLLFAETTNLGEFLQSHLTLIERYEAFNKIDDFATLTRPSAYDPLPPFNYIVRANGLVNLASINQLKISNSERAMNLMMS